MAIKRFEDLEIWQEARDLAKFVFEISKHDGFSEDSSLKDNFEILQEVLWTI